jgi:uncharacterized membrane protein YphA (DoxX/SURF4 family)
MTAGPNKSQTVASWVLRVVLGLLFLAVGTAKLTGTGHTIAYFAAIGWGQWFRYLTGLFDLGGTVLLFVPRWTCYGAIILAISVGLAAVISLTVLQGNRDWGGSEMVTIPLVITLLAVSLAWMTRPRPLRAS